MAYALALTTGCDALLLGRVIYEGMAQAWPNTGGNPYADHVNAMAKYVVASQPVDTSAWNPTVVVPGDDFTAGITKLMEQDGGDILIWGNGRLTDHLATAGLLDEYRIWIHPVLKGRGEPLFRPGSVTGVKLAGTTTFTSGVTVLAYEPTSGRTPRAYVAGGCDLLPSGPAGVPAACRGSSRNASSGRPGIWPDAPDRLWGERACGESVRVGGASFPAPRPDAASTPSGRLLVGRERTRPGGAVSASASRRGRFGSGYDGGDVTSRRRMRMRAALTFSHDCAGAVTREYHDEFTAFSSSRFRSNHRAGIYR